MFTFLGNNRGATLIEVLVAAAILGMIALATATQMSNMQQSINYFEFKSNILTLNQQIQSRLKFSEACKNAIVDLGDQKFILSKANSSSGSPVKIDLGNGHIVEEGKEISSYFLSTAKLAFIEPTSLGKDPLGNDLYQVSLVGAFSPTKKVLGPPISKETAIAVFNLTVSPSNKIIECSGESPLGIIGGACIDNEGTIKANDTKWTISSSLNCLGTNSDGRCVNCQRNTVTGNCKDGKYSKTDSSSYLPGTSCGY